MLNFMKERAEKMAKKSTNKKAIYKTPEFYFILVYALLTLAFIIQAFTINVIPMKYFVIVAIILLLLLIAMYYLQMGKRVNKFNKVLGKILIVILSIILGVGNWYFFKTSDAFRKMTGSDTDVSVVSVVVMKNSSIKDIADLTNKKLGTISVGDSDTQTKALSDIEKDINTKPVTVSYSSYKQYGDDLYEGKVDAILVNEGSRGMFEDEHSDFNNKTRVIKEYKYETKSKAIAKGVNVTTEPFNVYITGIDTYGTIATVSRSDVNMIVSVNPKTHQILMTGVPRDFYVPQVCQNNQLDKLTHTGIFGVDCTIDSMENYLGIKLNYYARVNFSSLINIVDALGGITVNSPFEFTTRHGQYHITVGENSLNGDEALGFVRERYSLADGDRERSRNQMRALTAIINKALSPTIITNYTGIMSAVSGSFQTNMSQSEMTAFVKAQLNDMSGWDIKQIQVSGQGATKWTPANGFNAYVMIPNEACVKNAVKLINKIDAGETITQTDIDHQNELVSKAG